MNTGDEANDVAAQITSEIDAALIWPLQTLLGHDDLFGMLRDRARHTAQRLALQLASGDDQLAAQTAIDLAAALFPGETEIPADWWGTPLGRLMAQSVGHPTAEAVSFSVAGAMLGVSKGRAQQLAEEGKLDRHPDGGITSVSVRLRAQRRDQ